MGDYAVCVLCWGGFVFDLRPVFVAISLRLFGF